MKLAKLLCVSAFVCAFSNLILAQAAPDLENGFKNYGSYDGSHLDTVNVMNGNLMLHIPVLPAYAQRGEFAPQYSLYVTSKAWQTHCKPDTSSSTGQICWWDSNNPGVMLINAEGLLARRTLVKTFSGTGQTLYATQQYSITGPDGSVHQLAPVPDQPLDANSDPTVFESLDTSGYHLTVSNPDTNGVENNVTVTDRNGIQYQGVFSTYSDFHQCFDPGRTIGFSLSGYKTLIDGSPAGDGFCPQAAYATQATDPNGNQMIFWSTNISSTPPELITDTLGRRMPLTFTPANPGTPDLTKCVSARAIISADLLYYIAPDGTTQQIQRCYANTPIQTAFGVPNYIEAPSSNSSLSQGQLLQLVTLVLADGSKWTFDYDSYGNVTYVGLPAGGHLAYTWTTIFIPAPYGSTGWSRAVKTRTFVTDSTHSSQWTYNWSSAVITLANTMTDPTGNDTVHLFTALDGMTSFYETSTQYFLGTKGGQPIKQVDVTYAPYTSLTENNLTANVVPTIIKTTLNPSGKVSQITKEYDPGYGPGSSIFGNVTKQFEYDWGQGSPGPLLRETDTTYQWQNDSRYKDAHMVDLPATVIIKDGSGCALAETDYAYDEAQYFTTTTIGTQHVAAPNPSPVRGNQTTVTRWLAATSSCNPKGGTAVSSHANWYDTGEPYQKIDPLGHTSTLSYDPAYAAAYVTQTCSPQTGSVTHCVSGTYDFNTGVLTSLTNENATAQASGNTPGDQAHTSNFAYDFIFRITSAQAPPDPANGGSRAQTSFTFSAPNIFPLSVQRTKSITTTLSDTASNFFDGLGRVTQGQHVLPAGTSKVDTTFDIAGRVATVSNPYFTSADPTYGFITNLYDPLDRVYQTTKQDGSISSVSYDQAIPGVAGVCTVSTDEAGKLRRACSDALGRLVEVDEPNPGAQATYAQASVSIAGSEQANAQSGSSGSGYIDIGGSEGTNQVCTDPEPPAHPVCTTSPDVGSVSIQVGTYPAKSVSFAGTSTPSSTASALAAAFHNDAAAPADAVVSPTIPTRVMLTARGIGVSTNYALSANPSQAAATDFYATAFGPTLTGGRDPSSSPDTGSVTVTLNGTPYQTTYGGSDTTSSIATRLATAISGGSWANASASGGTVTITAKTTGPGSDYALSASSSYDSAHFAQPSFTPSPSASALSGGYDAAAIDNQPFRTLYAYDALGNLLRVDQKGSAPSDSSQWRIRTFTYDSLSRLVTATNPESGTITYSYDADGNLLQKTSPAPNQTGTATQTVSYCYDTLHRVSGKGYGAQTCPLATPVVTYAYDSGTNAKGKLTSLTDQAGTASYTYDILGRLATETRTITGANNAAISKTLSYDYNLDGSLKTLHYPSGAAVTYTPDSAGRTLSAVDSSSGINYVTNATYGPDSALTGFVSGNSGTFAGITNAFSYNKRLQPLAMSATAPSQTVFSIGYDFHVGAGNNGNVFGITNYKDLSRNQSFTYDSLNRLTSAQNAGANCAATVIGGKTEYWGNSYSYDAWGNLTNKSVTKCSAENFSVAALTNNQLSGYAYDAAGNMTHDATSGLNYAYDSENRVTGAGGYTYTYDGDGNRVRKSNGNLAANGTLYWAMTPGLVTETDLAGTLKSEYVFFDGERVARKDFPSNAVSYYFSDHLKTASVITDSTGNIKSESDYYPWGGELQFLANDSNHYKFTSKERDTESGLDYFGARYYSNGLGRFITPDWSAVPVPVPYADLTDPQSLNQYTYVRNVPTSRVDADGHETLFSSQKAEDDFGQRMDKVDAFVVRALNHPAVQGFLEVFGFKLLGAEEGAGAGAGAAERGAAKGAEESVAAGAAKGEAAAGETSAAAVPKQGDPAPEPYNRSEHYGNPATSKAAKDIRAEAEGQPCPSCGKTMQSGTKNAPTAQHSPTLKSHYYNKGHKMTPAQRRAYARSKESMDGGKCKECQSKEGAAEKLK